MERTCRTLTPFSEQDIVGLLPLGAQAGRRGTAHAQNRWAAGGKTFCSQLGRALWRKQDFRSCWNDCRRQLDRMGWGRHPTQGLLPRDGGNLEGGNLCLAERAVGTVPRMKGDEQVTWMLGMKEGLSHSHTFTFGPERWNLLLRE